MAITEILLPLMGEGVNEATVSSWLSAVGDKVSKDAPLLEVSTDKVDTEIPSPVDGYLTQVLVGEGETVEVNQVLAIIGDKLGETAGVKEQGASPSQSEDQKPSIDGKDSFNHASIEAPPLRSSPLVRKIAAENRIDLSQVQGTGLHGRITKKDVLAFMDQDNTASTSQPKPTAPIRSPQSIQVQDTSLSSLLTQRNSAGEETLEGVVVQRQPLSRMRRLIADHMVESVRTSPHVTTVFEMDLNKVVKIREAHKDRFFQDEGFKLTYTPFLLHAAVQAIKQFPIVNSSLDGYDLLMKKDINLGCAVALDGGLIVPVIKNAGDLSLAGIARRLNDLVLRARSKKLKPDDVQGGTFSVTNPGGFGSLTSNPIINQPQVAILGIGAIVKRPVVVDDLIGIRPLMMASLTFDHRVIDGEVGAKFLAAMKDVLENYSEVPR